MRTISPVVARRLAITRQRLAGPRPSASADAILELVRDLGCLQLDPISAVARSHLLVLWSRLGPYDPADLDTLLWQERRLFEYWAHAASIVLTEDYPIHHLRMRAEPGSILAWRQRLHEWVEANSALRDQILSQLRQSGPLLARALENTTVTVDYLTFVERKLSTVPDVDDVPTVGKAPARGWNWGRNVDRMLDFLWSRGEIMVAGRSGGQKLWDLAERCLPEWTPREPMPEAEAVRQAAQRSLRALGVGTSLEIARHFTRGRYPGLKAVLADLEAEGRLERVQVGEGSEIWPGVRYIHVEDLPLLDRLEVGAWEPRTTLLSPFDNLICDRDRTQRLFDFDFRIEIYVPAAQRQYGYYVLPILHGDRLIGRIDPTMDRRQKRLTINAVHAEPDAPATDEAARAVAAAIEDLGAFLGAREIVYGERMPDAWSRVLSRA